MSGEMCARDEWIWPYSEVWRTVLTLILFDIDGTLTATGDSDARCYKTAFERTFEIPLPTTDWHHYRHVTDTGIIHEVTEKARGECAGLDEISRFEQMFVEDLKADYARDPRGFAEIPGAAAMLRHVTENTAHHVALATGGMRASATYKLSCIGVDATKMVGAYANDDISRGGIALRALERAVGNANAESVDCVYVGDGVWDLRNARTLGFRFVGITHEYSEERLRGAGASHCVTDYTDLDAFMDAIENARIPEEENVL
jgi:phosphoglycolate phosphatase-like HAD superfamily hydrolase